MKLILAVNEDLKWNLILTSSCEVMTQIVSCRKSTLKKNVIYSPSEKSDIKT